MYLMNHPARPINVLPVDFFVLMLQEAKTALNGEVIVGRNIYPETILGGRYPR